MEGVGDSSFLYLPKSFGCEVLDIAFSGKEGEARLLVFNMFSYRD